MYISLKTTFIYWVIECRFLAEKWKNKQQDNYNKWEEKLQYIYKIDGKNEKSLLKIDTIDRKAIVKLVKIYNEKKTISGKRYMKSRK